MLTNHLIRHVIHKPQPLKKVVPNPTPPHPISFFDNPI